MKIKKLPPFEVWMVFEQWIRGWLKFIFEKRKEVPDYRSVIKEVEFNKSGVPKEHPFRDREFKGAFKKSKEWEGPGNPLPDGTYSEAEAADYSVREDEVLGDNWPHIAYSLHHQSKKEGTK